MYSSNYLSLTINQSLLKLKQFIKDYFSFNKGERTGILIGVLILVIIGAIPFIMPFFIKKEPVDFTAFKKEFNDFNLSLRKNNSNKSDSISSSEFDYDNINKSSAEAILHPFNFDPNNLPEEKWREMGFSENQIRTIKNYEAKGGKFYKKEDLKKIYGISKSEYALLEPFIQITSVCRDSVKFSKTIFQKSDKNTVVIELNSADTTDLKKLKGIGSWYAKKIIAYRTKMGGFYNKEQLMEVKGIDSIRFAGFSDFVMTNKYLVKTININTATFDEMKTHPYIGYNIAQSLINLRNLHGKFVSVADIKKSALVTENIYAKLSPYLTVE